MSNSWVLIFECKRHQSIRGRNLCLWENQLGLIIQMICNGLDLIYPIYETLLVGLIHNLLPEIIKDYWSPDDVCVKIGWCHATSKTIRNVIVYFVVLFQPIHQPSWKKINLSLYNCCIRLAFSVTFELNLMMKNWRNSKNS